jgi:hypothetical protein
MSMIWMTHTGVVGVVQVDQQAFNDVWSHAPYNWTQVPGPAADPGVRTVLAKGDVSDGQVPAYDAATGYYIPADPAAASLPAGGSTNQVLTKQSDGSVNWSNGTPGPAGKDGPPGQNGKPGKDATANAGRWG